MGSQFDETDFVDRDYLSSKAAARSDTPAPNVFRPPSREELDTRVGENHQKLAELKQAQEKLERERAALEEARRRRIEYHTGREEMLEGLTRGVGLLEEGEFAARRDAEQMAKTLAGLREALAKVEALTDQHWNNENWNVELTRALTTLENARLEWNAARLKWAFLSGGAETRPETKLPANAPGSGRKEDFLSLCRTGLALTWPVVLVCLIGFGTLIALILRR